MSKTSNYLKSRGTNYGDNVPQSPDEAALRHPGGYLLDTRLTNRIRVRKALKAAGIKKVPEWVLMNAEYLEGREVIPSKRTLRGAGFEAVEAVEE